MWIFWISVDRQLKALKGLCVIRLKCTSRSIHIRKVGIYIFELCFGDLGGQDLACCQIIFSYYMLMVKLHDGKGMQEEKHFGYTLLLFIFNLKLKLNNPSFSV